MQLNQIKLQAEIQLTDQLISTYRDEIQTTAKRTYVTFYLIKGLHVL